MTHNNNNKYSMLIRLSSHDEWAYLLLLED